MSGSPVPVQKTRGSWKPGMDGKEDHAPVQFSAGVGGMLTSSDGVAQ